MTFILWGGYSKEESTTTTLTTVNGDDISYPEFHRLLSRQLEVYGQFMGGGKKLSDQIVQLVERQIASGLVMRKVMAQKAASMGIVVGDDEIMSILEKNTAFQDPTLKRFSPTVYQAVLEANSLKPASFEAGLREELASERMKDLLEQSITVSDKEIEEAHRIQSQAMNLDVATFDPAKLISKNKISITDAAIEQHFKAHQGEYLSQERRVGTFAALSVASFGDKISVSDADVQKFYDEKVKGSKDGQWSEPRARAFHILIAENSDKGLKRAQALTSKITSLESFQATARRESEDYSNASKGGDLGYFNEKAMVKPFSEAVFSKAKPNSLYGPVKTDFGYHIIWVTDRTSNQSSLENRKGEISYLLRQEVMKNQVDALKKDLEQKLKGSKTDITENLRAKGFQIFENTEFDNRSRLENIPYVVLMDALHAPLQEWQGPTEHDGSLYFFRIQNSAAAKPLPLAEARPQIVKRLESEEAEKFAKSIGEKLKKSQASWESLTAMGADTTSHKGIKPFQMTEVPGFGPVETLVQSVQKLKPTDAISAPLFHDSKWIIFKASQWTSAQNNIPDSDRTKIRDEIISKKRTSVLEAYVQGLVKSAKIPEGFRKKYNL